MTLRRLALALVTAALVVTGVQAWACDCAATTAEEAAQQADAVAHVRIDRIEYDLPGHSVYYTVTPLRVWKGSFDASFLVRTSTESAACGLPEQRLHNELLLFAETKEDGRYAADSCGGTLTWGAEASSEITRALGPGAEPSLDPGHPVGEPKLEGVEPSLTSAIIASTVLLGMLGLVLGMTFARMRSRHR